MSVMVPNIVSKRKNICAIKSELGSILKKQERSEIGFMTLRNSDFLNLLNVCNKRTTLSLRYEKTRLL